MGISEAAEIPPAYARRVIDVHGDAGVAWLARLPALLGACLRRWALRPGQPFGDLSYNYVLSATRPDGSDVVLKLGVPGAELTREADALRLMDGNGAVRLLAADVECGALLLERAVPGAPLTPLCERDDEEATAIAAYVMRRMQCSVSEQHRFQPVQEWGCDVRRLRERFGETSPLPTKMLDIAERLLDELTSSTDEVLLLHGDLHHGNILSAKREPWLAIDPKGVVGDPAAETGALIRNPMPDLLAWPRLAQVLQRRVQQLAEALSLDPARIHAWSIAQAVLAGVWMYEDHGQGWEPAFRVAEILLSFQV